MIIQIQQLFLNTATGVISQNIEANDETDIQLDHTPLELLLCLIKYKGENVSKETMLDEVWPNKVVSEDVLSVAISQIRKALRDNARKPTFIKTIPSVGYRLIAEVNNIPEKAHTNSIENSSSEFNTVSTEKNYSSHILVTVICLLTAIFYFYLNSSNQNNKTEITNKETAEKYQQGRYLLTQYDDTSWQEALQLFTDTLISNPDFAPVYLNIVETKFKLHYNKELNRLKIRDELVTLVNKSIELSPEQAHAYQLLARIYFQIDWNFSLAKQNFEKALTLSPADAEIHFEYAQFLLAAQQYDLAIKHTIEYINLEPKNYAIPTVAWLYNMREDFGSALNELNKLQKFKPDTLTYHITAHAIYDNMDNEAEAFSELLKIFQRFNYSENELAAAQKIFKQDGLSAVHNWLLVSKQEQRNIGQYLPPLSYARYAIRAGQLEQAKFYIKQAIELRQDAVLWIYADPLYKPIIDTPELKKILPTLKSTNLEIKSID